MCSKAVSGLLATPPRSGKAASSDGAIAPPAGLALILG